MQAFVFHDSSSEDDGGAGELVDPRSGGRFVSDMIQGVFHFSRGERKSSSRTAIIGGWGEIAILIKWNNCTEHSRKSFPTFENTPFPKIGPNEKQLKKKLFHRYNQYIANNRFAIDTGSPNVV